MERVEDGSASLKYISRYARFAMLTHTRTESLLWQIFQCERSSLWECVHRSTGERFCVKIMDFMDENVLHEVAMLKAAQGHGTVVELIQVFFEDSYNENDVSPGSEHSRSSGKIYLIMEFMAGGNLLSFVIQNGGLSEDVVRRLAVELLQAVEHLHTVAFLCHNDLNPSNILLDDPTCDSLKVSDFGSSISIHDSQKWINKHNKVEWDSCSKVDNSNSSVSTTRSLEKSSRSTNCHHTTNHPFRTATIGNDFSEFCAPEALYQRSGNRSASPTADMWSVGAVLSFCLLGQYGTSGVSLYPNSGNSETMLVAHGRSKSIGNDELMHSNLQRERHLTGSHVSRQAKQFLSSLLQLDPSLRLTPQEALGHSWLAGTVKQPSRKLSSPFVATESPVFAPPMTLNKPKFTDLAKKLHSKSPRSNPTISVLVAISYFTECFSSRLGNGCNLAVDSLKR